MSKKYNILLTGATGYIGGRLLRVLKKNGFHVSCLTRRPDALKHLENTTTKIIYGDALARQSLNEVFNGIDVAFYFIHSLGSKEGFIRQDQIAAQNFSECAHENGVKRIIYLGGLANPDENLSDHLQSRLEVGDYLRKSGIQVIEFRASIILGSGSLSFEMIRTLVEKLPIMIIPKWVRVKAQPIAINDVLSYLMESINIQTDENKIYEIGGSKKVSYMDIMKEYARQRNLKRLMIPVPVLSLKLSSYWLGLVTPLYARIGKKLIESVRYPTIIRDKAALQDFSIRPKSVKNAIKEALCYEDQEFAETRWSDALSSSGNVPRNWGGIKFGNRIIESRMKKVNVPPERAFLPIRRIGGESGWYYANWLWKLRGFLDLILGGVGLRRGRKSQDSMNVGEPLDFWRVEIFEPDKRLRLLAEMKLPARAWLEFEVKPTVEGNSEIHQTVIYDPIGLWGLLYWYLLYPFHYFIFSGMIRKIAKKCSRVN